MRLPRGVVRKRGRYFARIHTKGGERSYPLGAEPVAAAAAFYRVKAAVLAGKDPRLGVEPPAEADVTVAQAVARWVAEHVIPDLEPDNATTIRRRVEATLVPFFVGRAIRSIRRPDCYAYRGHVRATKPALKPGTLTHYLRDLRELLNWAEEVELIDESPWPRRRTRSGRGGIMPRLKKTSPDRLTEDEVAVCLALPDPLGFNLRLAIGTGLRWGELVAIKRTDLLPSGTLLIREAKDEEPRTVPVSPKLVVEILRRKGHLFRTLEEQAYSPVSNGSFNALVQHRTGIERFHVHMTRHTFACRYLEAGGELAMLQEILGHSSVVTTQRYGRPNAKAIKGDAARVYAIWDAPDREQNREQVAKAGSA